MNFASEDQAREFCEQVGLPLELDTDGIWCHDLQMLLQNQQKAEFRVILIYYMICV
jgi:hypothetical protein